jgi:hypothetical protein
MMKMKITMKNEQYSWIIVKSFFVCNFFHFLVYPPNIVVSNPAYLKPSALYRIWTRHFPLWLVLDRLRIIFVLLCSCFNSWQSAQLYLQTVWKIITHLRQWRVLLSLCLEIGNDLLGLKMNSISFRNLKIKLHILVCLRYRHQHNRKVGFTSYRYRPNRLLFRNFFLWGICNCVIFHALFLLFFL